MKTEAIKDLEQVKKLLRLSERDWRDNLLIRFALHVPLRISDLLELTVEDIIGKEDELDNGLQVKERKTGKIKDVFIPLELEEKVKELVRERRLFKMDHLFNNKRGYKLTRSGAYRIIKHYGDMLGLRLSAHSLRKTLGYHHFLANDDIQLLQTVFNHSTERQTLTYIGITKDEVRESLKNLPY